MGGWMKGGWEGGGGRERGGRNRQSDSYAILILWSSLYKDTQSGLKITGLKILII